MGVDFGAVLDVTLGWFDLPKLPPRLDLVADELSGVWGGLDPDERQKRWTLDLQAAWYFNGWDGSDADAEVCRLQPGLIGPWGFLVVPHAATASVGHHARWKFFLQDLDERDRLRRSCRLIGDALGAGQIAYVPDLAEESIGRHALFGGPFGPILAHLQDKWGPASDLASAYPIGERYWERYFVERI